jgi:hypothetical protein
MSNKQFSPIITAQLDIVRGLLKRAGTKGIAAAEEARRLNWQKFRMRDRLRQLREIGEAAVSFPKGEPITAARWVYIEPPPAPVVVAPKIVEPPPVPFEDEVDRWPITRRMVKANDVPPLRKPGPASVFEWGR